MLLTPISSVASGLATVARIDLEGFEAARLKAMGLYEGQTVELSHRGDPLIVKAAGGRVALAAAVARCIMVSVDEK